MGKIDKFKSTKLAYAVFTALLMVVAAFWVPAAVYSELTTGLTFLAGLVISGNVAAKWVMNRKASIATTITGTIGKKGKKSEEHLGE